MFQSLILFSWSLLAVFVGVTIVLFGSRLQNMFSRAIRGWVASSPDLRRAPSVTHERELTRVGDAAEKSGPKETDFTANFPSILFETKDGKIKNETIGSPNFFADLNLDQVIAGITAAKQEYNLAPFFHTSLSEISAISYRHQIFRDLENEVLFRQITEFALRMRAMREHLMRAEKLHYRYQKELWHLDAVDIYCDAVSSLSRDLGFADLQSSGLRTIHEYLRNYIGSARFESLLAESKKLKNELATVEYCMLLKGSGIEIRKYESELDYSADVESTFEKFKQGAKREYKAKFYPSADMNHVEAAILDLVAKLYPEIFVSLGKFGVGTVNYLDEAIKVFDREIQFYVAFLEYASTFKRAGLKFCYPKITGRSKEVYDYEEYDLALAQKLIRENADVVTNDFYLKGDERIFVVSGPNQGGKTTFARSFGQLHHLASIGCPVPGREAQLFLFDRLFTHFEKEENMKNLRGKLQDDLVRIHQILNEATPNSIIIMNEIFTSTTLKDAILLGTKVLEKIIDLDLLCVCVTFIDELASLGAQTVSLVGTVVPENSASRTYKVVRKPADGLSYALSVAEKYHLTYNCLKERIKS
jgi:DNA mismatch repair protein MutS